jgi:hypothetical protein
VFFGSIPDALEFFRSAGYACPTHVNPGDFFLDLISIDRRSVAAERQSLERIEHLVQHFARSQSSAALDSSLSRLADMIDESADQQACAGSACAPALPTSATFQLDDSTRGRINYFAQIGVLFERTMLNMARDRMVILSRVLEAIVLGFLVGLIFFQLDDTPSGIKSRIAALYSSTALQPFLIMLSIIIQCMFRVIPNTESEQVCRWL